MCTMSGQVPRKARRGHRIPGIEVIGSCELFNMTLGTMLFTSASSPAPILKMFYIGQVVAVHTFNPSAQEAEAGGSL